MIITVMSNKGGVGKTTMATIIAELAFNHVSAGLKHEDVPTPVICAVDFDRQHDLVDNLTKVLEPSEPKPKIRKSNKKAQVKEEDFLKYIHVYAGKLAEFDRGTILQFDQDYRYVVIDTPPSMDTKDVETLAEISDAIVVPFITQDHAMRGMKNLMKILSGSIKKCITVHLRERGTVIEIIKIWYQRFVEKYRPFIENTKANFEITMYANVPKNLDRKDFFWKGLLGSSRTVYKDLWKKIIE